MITFILNSETITTDEPAGSVMLDFVRYHSHLKGTKIGCREGDCGACTVLVGELKNGEMHYQSMTSCLMPLGNAAGKHIVTVEGINGPALNPVQQAIVDTGGTQCGFCTVGFVMSLIGFCMSSKNPDYTQALASIDGNICRCTGYKSLERAAALIVEKVKERDEKNIIHWLVQQQYLPEYFSGIKARLQALAPSNNVVSNLVKVGGGTDVYVQKHAAMVHESIDFVLNKPEMKGIRKNGKLIEIGASVTVEELRNNELICSLFPNLYLQLKLISSTPIRNMATLAGNFVNASPIGDMSILFLALNAKIVLEKDYQKRSIYLKDFYKAYKTLDKLPDENLVQIVFEIPSESAVLNFEKVSKRKHLDIASVNSALLISTENSVIKTASLSMGGVFAYPKLLAETANFLVGKALSEQVLIDATKILQSEIQPISDARGTTEYKRLLARQLFFAHFIELFPNTIAPAGLLEKLSV